MNDRKACGRCEPAGYLERGAEDLGAHEFGHLVDASATCVEDEKRRGVQKHSKAKTSRERGRLSGGMVMWGRAVQQSAENKDDDVRDRGQANSRFPAAAESAWHSK